MKGIQKYNSVVLGQINRGTIDIVNQECNMLKIIQEN